MTLQLSTLAILGTSSLLVSGHTWIDSIECGGSLKYIRGYTPRGQYADAEHLDAEGNPIYFDDWNTYRMEGRNGTDNMCATSQQQVTTGEKLLHCSAGSTVTFTYRPNGHVTKDGYIAGDPRFLKVSKNGQTYQSRKTYWTIAVHPWDSNGQAPTVLRGDVNPLTTKPMKNVEYPNFDTFNGLISPGFKETFDDGTCGEIFNTENFQNGPCRGTFVIPEDTPNGGMQFMFYWIFDRDWNGEGEEYTSCFDIKVTNSNLSTTLTPSPSVTHDSTSLSTHDSTSLSTTGSTTCPDTSIGDRANGIHQYYDSTCGDGSKVGCISSTNCRHCRAASAVATDGINSHLVECPSGIVRP